MTTSSPLFQARKITVHYGGSSEPALNSVDLDIEKGERLALVGPNGSGKSTLLRILNGFQSVNQGTLQFEGRLLLPSMSSKELRQTRSQIGIVHQKLSLVGRLSALENVMIGLLGQNSKVKKGGLLRGWMNPFHSEDRSKAKQALQQVSLLHKANQRTDSLSGGEMQRVAIARALCQNPSVLIADEPVSALDPKASSEILRLLAKLSEENQLTLIVVMHELVLLPLFAKRVVALSEGRVAFDGNAKTFNLEEQRRIYQF